MTKEYWHGLDLDEEAQLLSEIDKMERLFLTQAGTGWNYWFQLIQSIRSFCQNAFSYTFKDGGKFLDKYQNKFGNLRDIQMGKNILWLMRERFSNEKIILWGATYHFARNLNDTNSTEMSHDYSDKITAGDIVWKSIPNDIFAIGFTAYQGQMGNHYIGTREIGKASETSLEHYLKGYDYAFLDFREYRGIENSPVNRIMRPLGYSEMKTNWADHIDGVFFIKTMTASRGY